MPTQMASAAVAVVKSSAGVMALCDDGRGQRRRGRHRAHDQMPRAAEQGVQQQRPGRGIEADDGRHPRDRCVGERLRPRTAQTRETRDDVAAQPRRLVAAE